MSASQYTNKLRVEALARETKVQQSSRQAVVVRPLNATIGCNLDYSIYSFKNVLCSLPNFKPCKG
jgi:hypothetical protein